MKRLVVVSIVLMFVTLGWGGIRVGEQPLAPRGELRIVDQRTTNRYSIQNAGLDYLLDVDGHGRIVPRLARSWRWDNDRTLVLSLRQGVSFHNGEVFDAALVKQNWEAWREVFAWLARASTGMGGGFPSEARLEVLDAHTVRIVLPRPQAGALLTLRALPMTNRQFFRTLEQRARETGNVRMRRYFRTLRRPGPWGTGPYKLVAGAFWGSERTDQVVLEANLDYWDKERFPQVRRIIFDQTLQRKEAVELLKTSEGRVDLVTDVRPLDTLRVSQSPFGRVVKERSSVLIVLGMFNTRKAGSPWHDVRLRQAVNYAINRADFLRYAVKGNGVLVPSFLAPGSFGYDPTIQPYPFAPDTARRLLQEVGHHAGGFAIKLIASEHLEVQATVVSKMLEQVGFTVEVQRLDPVSMFKSVNLWWFLAPYRNPRPPWPAWDIALFTSQTSSAITSAYLPGGMYRAYALYDGWYDWVSEQPEFRRLHAQISRTLDREQQRTLIQQIERHIHEQAYFLFLYSPLQVHAVNKEVRFVPRPDALLDLVDLAVTDQHWSVRQEKTAGQK